MLEHSCDDRLLPCVDSCKTLGGSLTKHEGMYLKMIFEKNLDQATGYLQFKFQAVPTESAGTCHFAEKWMESLVTHLISELHIKYGLLFVKNSVGAFWQNSLVDASQKLFFSMFGKRKIDFLFK